MITSKKIKTNLKILFEVLEFFIGLDYFFYKLRRIFEVNSNNLITSFASHCYLKPWDIKIVFRRKENKQKIKVFLQ